ncbi:hypothetical protein MANES_05G204650v8 [Manihot esculenta]|uniref:Uncharacterized protein n=1 Tax=Manihot esculenta TaxID=3983 RepID=A0ACB7HQY3_MANES|nr:hypothetical protein MANES_05G204650v8 [Manihot esculenta]
MARAQKQMNATGSIFFTEAKKNWSERTQRKGHWEWNHCSELADIVSSLQIGNGIN